jgi:hypothetical protein
MSSFVHVVPVNIGVMGQLLSQEIEMTTETSETIETSELDDMQAAYKASVEAWISSIRNEEALASVNHSVAEIDQWEKAHLDQEESARRSRRQRRNTKTPCAPNSSDSEIPPGAVKCAWSVKSKRPALLARAF